MIAEKQIQHMLEVLETPRQELSSWEVDFVASVTDLFLGGEHNLSKRQIEKLESIYLEKGE